MASGEAKILTRTESPNGSLPCLSNWTVALDAAPGVEAPAGANNKIPPLKSADKSIRCSKVSNRKPLEGATAKDRLVCA